jgi:hypothetical protein
MPRVDKILDMFQIYKVKTTIYYIVDMRCVHLGSRYAVNGRVSSIDIYSPMCRGQISLCSTV